MCSIHNFSGYNKIWAKKLAWMYIEYKICKIALYSLYGYSVLEMTLNYNR